MAENTSIHSRLYASARQQELERVTEFIKDIRAGAATCFFLNFFAPGGFAKTVLLEQIWNSYERILPASFIRAKDFFRGNETFALRDLLIHIIHELDFRLPKRIANLPSGYESSTDKVWLSELVVKLILSAKDFEKVTLLLFDDYDAMPDETRNWFETRILSPLVRIRNTAVILTSEGELRFAGIDLRMRLENCELSSLSTEAISRALPRYEEIADEIYSITGGLPILTEDLVQQLDAAHVATAAEFRSREEELSREYYRTHINEKVFQGIDKDMRETILALGLLRRFDVKVLSRVLPRVYPKYYEGYGTAEYLDLIERLGSWVQWRMQGGYALNPAYRIVLPRYLLTDNPKLHEQVNRVAMVSYREFLKKEYREYYLIELLYHLLILLRFERGAGLPFTQDTVDQAKLGDELLKYLSNSETAAQLQEVDLVSLRNSLLQDPDLKGYISGDILLAIQRQINAKIETKRVIPFRAESR